MPAIVPNHYDAFEYSFRRGQGGMDRVNDTLLSSPLKPLLMRHCVLGSYSQVSRRMVNHVITAIETRGKHRRYLLLLQACIVLRRRTGRT
jgi:hypothetical protein